jgi:hypothetical protein
MSDSKEPWKRQDEGEEEEDDEIDDTVFTPPFPRPSPI